MTPTAAVQTLLIDVCLGQSAIMRSNVTRWQDGSLQFDMTPVKTESNTDPVIFPGSIAANGLRPKAVCCQLLYAFYVDNTEEQHVLLLLRLLRINKQTHKERQSLRKDQKFCRFSFLTTTNPLHQGARFSSFYVQTWQISSPNHICKSKLNTQFTYKIS